VAKLSSILLTVTLVVSTLASTFGALVIQCAFTVHQDYIAEHLCENPDSDCDGMCYLQDRMESHHGHDEPVSSAPATVPPLPVLLAVSAPGSAVPHMPSRDAGTPEAHPEDLLREGVAADVFRPPRAA